MRIDATILGRAALALLLVLASGCCGLITYKPSCDPAPILALQPPATISTLKALPHGVIYAEDGIHIRSGSRMTNGIKESFEFSDENAEYGVWLWLTEEYAMESLKFPKTNVPIFSETNRGHVSFRLYYVNQPRADPEGGCVPMSYFTSRATIRIKNATIDITAHDDKVVSDRLSRAVTSLGAMLAPIFQKENIQPNQPPQRNAGSRPSSGDSPASKTPSSLGPRG